MNRRAGIAALVWLCACGSGGADSDAGTGLRADAAPAAADAAQQPGTDGAQTHADAGADPGATLSPVGRFEITLVPEEPARDDLAATPAHAVLLGQVHAYARPSATTWRATREEGDCRLLAPTHPFCDPACAGSALCVEDGRCVEQPEALDLGTVTLGGLRWEGGEGVIELEPLPPKSLYQFPGSLRLSYPPFDEGTGVGLETAGGELPKIALTATAIAPLEVVGAGALRFARDAITQLRWTPPTDPSASRIRVIVDISHHGGQKGEIDCETDDDGSLDIPQSIGAGLIDLGVAGFPSVQIIRESIAVTAIGDGRVELALASPVTRELEIPGLVSCMEPGMQDACPDGQLCQDDKRCE